MILKPDAADNMWQRSSAENCSKDTCALAFHGFPRFHEAMNTTLRTLLLALLALIAMAARAMPCPMTPALPVAVEAAHDGHCAGPAGQLADPAAASHRAVMSLGDCLAAQPGVPQTPAAALAAPAHVEPAPLPGLPELITTRVIDRAPPAQPPPLTQALASRLWSSTQRLLL